ncbi:MAG: sulfate transporter subunit, partial [Gemmataceae bacterium]|nr:sulfate transporter subunit [Gemmataceae bacterium]
TRGLAEEYLRFLYTEAAQEIIGKHAYRPRNPAILQKFADRLPALPMFTVDEVAGSWDEAARRFFAEGGVFHAIYQKK